MTEPVKAIKKRYKYKYYIKTETPYKYERIAIKRQIKSYKPKNQERIAELRAYVDNLLTDYVAEDVFFDTNTVEDGKDIGILELKDFYYDLENQIGLHRILNHNIFGSKTKEVIDLLEKHKDAGAIYYIEHADEFDKDDILLAAFVKYHKEYRKYEYKHVAIPLWTKEKTFYYKFTA